MKTRTKCLKDNKDTIRLKNWDERKNTPVKYKYYNINEKFPANKFEDILQQLS